MSDLERVYEIELASYPSPWPLQSFVDELTRNNYAYYMVAENAGGIVGYAGMWLISGEAHITNIAVDPAYRRRGIAEQLLVRQIEHSLEHRATAIFLEVRRYNIPAQRLYTRYRFTPTQVREKYYQDNQEDAIELRAEDLGGDRFISNFRRRRRELLDSLGIEHFPAPPVVS